LSSFPTSFFWREGDEGREEGDVEGVEGKKQLSMEKRIGCIMPKLLFCFYAFYTPLPIMTLTFLT
jgi:hypothetical protein